MAKTSEEHMATTVADESETHAKVGEVNEVQQTTEPATTSNAVSPGVVDNNSVVVDTPPKLQEDENSDCVKSSAKAQEEMELSGTSKAAPSDADDNNSVVSDAPPKLPEDDKNACGQSTTKVDENDGRADSVESTQKAEPLKAEPVQKDAHFSSAPTVSSQLPPPPPKPSPDAETSKPMEIPMMPMPPPPPGAPQRPPGLPLPPRPPGIEAMPWVPPPPSGRGAFAGFFANGLGNGLSVATGGGPEVLEVWRNYFQLYRQYVAKLAAEGDHTNPLFTASALGGVRSEKVCVHHLTGNCRRGFRCIDRHPVEGQFKVHVRDFKRKQCRYGDQCRTPKCLYYHPHEGDAWGAVPLETGG